MDLTNNSNWPLCSAIFIKSSEIFFQSLLISVKLKHFQKFADTTEALAAATATVEGKVSKTLKKTLKKLIVEEAQSQLLVADAKLGNAIKDKLDLQCVANTGVQELLRCIRTQSDSLLAGLPKKEMTAMALGLAHSLSRYKLKFSPDKIDTMIVQAQCLLDDLDKELNNYMMRAREWYVGTREALQFFFPKNFTFSFQPKMTCSQMMITHTLVSLIVYDTTNDDYTTFSWLSDENHLHAVPPTTPSLYINRLGRFLHIPPIWWPFRYGWHFPELSKLITDNIAFVKTVKLVGTRENMATTDLSDILPEDVEEKVKEAAEISMGTEISEEDILNIQSLCDEVLAINEYRTHLSDYLKARMLAMAPNLTVLVGETIGARLIAHSGSLVNLAKHPASTVQILGKNLSLFLSKRGLIWSEQGPGHIWSKLGPGTFFWSTLMILKVWFRLNNTLMKHNVFLITTTLAV